MAAWRTLGVVIAVLAAADMARAETFPLAEAVQAGDCFRIQLELSLTGEIKVARDGKPAPIKLSASARHEFPERILQLAAGLPIKTARNYDFAKATITAGREVSERVLRTDRRLFVAQRHKDVPLVYCPAGALTREELELTSEHFDTLCLTGLLPAKEVAVGEAWKVANNVAQALCGFEGLSEQSLTCKLEEVTANIARVSVAGTANGIDLGAQVKLTIEASYHFDLTAKRLTKLTWKQQDDREQGPASPATSVQTTTTLVRSAIDQPESLNDAKLVVVADGFEPPLAMTQLLHRDPKRRFDLLFGREWQVVGQTDEHLVMRLMERGEFLAQVTITPWTAAEKGKHLSPAEFRDAMDETPGWEASMELQAGEVPSGDSRWIYRISQLGTLDGSDVMQNFYLAASPDGEQVVLAFTLTPKQADRLGSRDLSLAGSLAFPGK